MGKRHRINGDRAYWHWQNLDEDRQGRVKGKGWRNGRAWLNLRVDEDGKSNDTIEASIQWVVRHRNSTSLSLSLGGGDGATNLDMHISLLGTGVYLGLDSPLTEKLTRKLCPAGYDRERELSIRFHDKAAWWYLWMNPHEWRSRDPKWRRGCFHVDDWALGQNKYQNEVLEERQVLVPMPEGAYPATAKLELATWTRQRFGWPATRLTRIHLEVPDGIPHPGKGENAWDCGEDATYGITAPANSIEEGISKLVESVLTRRTRYGGKAWMPSEAAA